MNRAFVTAASVFALGSSALAVDAVDQFNDKEFGGYGWSYLNPYFEASQSFKQTAGQISGASIYCGDSWGDGDVTLAIYATEPYADGGANPIAGASGTSYGTHGNWVDVFWSPVNITAGQTYWLGMTGSAGGVVTTYTSNTYGNGDLYWYGNTVGGSYSDFAFKTWAPVPTPGAAALLGIGGLAATRRRRA